MTPAAKTALAAAVVATAWNITCFVLDTGPVFLVMGAAAAGIGTGLACRWWLK